MFESFQFELIDVGEDIRIFTRFKGSGPPLLLLHGYPQTHVCWHKIAEPLAEHFTIVLTDLRGYGASSKPIAGPNHLSYSKRAMASDQACVMSVLGFERFYVAGHDRGGRVAHRLALDHAERIRRLAVLDIAPTATMYANANRDFAEAYYHWFFLIQPFDLPERLIGSDPEFYLRKTLDSWCKKNGAISDEAMTAYKEAFSAPNAVHAACEDYRAAATIDLEHDHTDDLASHKITAPLLALWGSQGTIGRQFDVLACWREKSRASVYGEALNCGHFLPEEAPEATLDAFLRFFADG